MATKALERELLDLEERYWRAMKEKDADAALRLTDDPCIVTSAQGIARIDKATLERMLRTASWTLNEFEIEDDAEVRQVNDDVAILAYKVREKLTVDGKPVTVDAADASMWVRRGDRWVCALHTESIAGDPFGRDRRPTSQSPSAGK
ncbi:MAG TPA: nuclear transport factor 2 family protein [Thermomicrobiales bacterium]|nr:nuclear transport factor 2 family protein [Thermomicrobiales bacterium]